MLGDLAVQRGPPARTHAQIQRLAHQVVRERISHNHTRSGWFFEQGFHIGLGHSRDAGEDAEMRRTDHTGDLEQLDRLLAQPGEPVLEDLPHARWDHACRRTATRLETGDLGGEERIAAGAPVHLVDVVLARLHANDVLDQGRGRMPVETCQRETPHSG